MAKRMSLMCDCLICKSGKCGFCRQAAANGNEEGVLSHKLITSEHDVMALNIIDWQRLNGSWNNPGDALHTISSWFINMAHATVVEADLSQSPKRDDFPGWSHTGNHENVGKLFWNWFHWRYGGELIFSDAPDFYGTLKFQNDPDEPTVSFWKSNDMGHAHFWGDIGYVSAQAFAITQKQMGFGDIWISVFDDKQVIIEPLVDISEIAAYGSDFWEDVRKGLIVPSWSKRKLEPTESQIIKPTQLRLF